MKLNKEFRLINYRSFYNTIKCITLLNSGNNLKKFKNYSALYFQIVFEDKNFLSLHVSLEDTRIDLFL